jgi:hypothetical protein
VQVLEIIVLYSFFEMREFMECAEYVHGPLDGII